MLWNTAAVTSTLGDKVGKTTRYASSDATIVTKVATIIEFNVERDASKKDALYGVLDGQVRALLSFSNVKLKVISIKMIV